MNEADKQAFEDWRRIGGYIRPPSCDSATAWGAACAYKDKQAGDPVLWMYDFPNPDSPSEMVRDWTARSTEEVARNNGVNVRPLGYLSSAVAVNEQMLVALDWCVAEINRESPSVINARAAIAAAKAAKTGESN
jgi:hypothetical protein